MTKHGRFSLQTILVIQGCLLYLVLEKTWSLVFRDDLPVIYDQNEYYRFYQGFIICCSSSLTCILVIFIFLFTSFNFLKKKLIVLINCLHISLFIPFYLSGFYLTVDRPGLQLNHNFQLVYEKGWEISQRNSSSDSFEHIIQTNKFYCCCGLENSDDIMDNSTLFTHILCPQRRFIIGGCSNTYYQGCSIVIPLKHRTRVKYFSFISLLTSLATLITSPFFYAIFEKERRLFRANYIRQWQIEWIKKFNNDRAEYEDITQLSSKRNIIHKNISETRYLLDNTQMDSYSQMPSTRTVVKI